jgi:predicted CXXCH cytochrome family protein
MRSGTWATVAVLALWVLVGAAYQGQKKEVPFPTQLFADAKDEDFMGQEACAACHPDRMASFKRSPHYAYVQDARRGKSKTGCEACHGPLNLHQAEQNARVVNYEKVSASDVAAACLRCHASTMKPEHWAKTPHAQNKVACTSCHQIHVDELGASKAVGAAEGTLLRSANIASHAAKKLLKAPEAQLCGKCHGSILAQFRLNSHHPVPEGVMACSDCHDLHPNKAAVKRSSVLKDKCVTCHQAQAGPFVYEHDPVAGLTGDGCQECHKPHGSNNPRNLKAFSRGLCLQCHTDKTLHNPGVTCWTGSCHVSMHGSNTDSRFLQR